MNIADIKHYAATQQPTLIFQAFDDFSETGAFSNDVDLDAEADEADEIDEFGRAGIALQKFEHIMAEIIALLTTMDQENPSFIKAMAANFEEWLPILFLIQASEILKKLITDYSVDVRKINAINCWKLFFEAIRSCPPLLWRSDEYMDRVLAIEKLLLCNYRLTQNEFDELTSHLEQFFKNGVAVYRFPQLSTAEQTARIKTFVQRRLRNRTSVLSIAKQLISLAPGINISIFVSSRLNRGIWRATLKSSQHATKTPIPAPLAPAPEPLAPAPVSFASAPEPFVSAPEPFASAPEPFASAPVPFASAPISTALPAVTMIRSLPVPVALTLPLPMSAPVISSYTYNLSPENNLLLIRLTDLSFLQVQLKTFQTMTTQILTNCLVAPNLNPLTPHLQKLLINFQEMGIINNQSAYSMLLAIEESIVNILTLKIQEFASQSDPFQLRPTRIQRCYNERFENLKKELLDNINELKACHLLINSFLTCALINISCIDYVKAKHYATLTDQISSKAHDLNLTIKTLLLAIDANIHITQEAQQIFTFSEAAARYPATLFAQPQSTTAISRVASMANTERQPTAQANAAPGSAVIDASDNSLGKKAHR